VKKRNREIRIPEYIVQAIEAHLSELPADSVEEYVESVLRERLNADGFAVQSPEEERELAQRLRDLGYLT